MSTSAHKLYWRYICIAAKNNCSFANSWQWLLGTPICMWILLRVRPYLSESAKLPDTTTILGFLEVTGAGFIITGIVGFLARLLLKAPVILYQELEQQGEILKRELEDQKRNTPFLIGAINQTNLSLDSKSGNVHCYFNVTITNRGTPSIAHEWAISVLCNGLIYSCKVFALPGESVLSNESAILTLTAQDGIYDKAASPIPSGGLVNGWLVTIINGLDIESLYKEGTRYEITFKDVNDKVYSAIHVIEDTKKGLPKYFPGGSGNKQSLVAKKIEPTKISSLSS